MPCRAFAIVPAAGQSRRMGRPKLLLPWEGVTLLEHVLSAWEKSDVTRTIVVARADDEPLRAACRDCDVDWVAPAVPPPEMKDSVVAALRHVEANYRPQGQDAWLLAPADMPHLPFEAINRLLNAHRENPGDILQAAREGKRGHPILFPWTMAEQAFRLTEQEGINQLPRRHGRRLVECQEQGVLMDLDTPEDYQSLEGASK